MIIKNRLFSLKFSSLLIFAMDMVSLILIIIGVCYSSLIFQEETQVKQLGLFLVCGLVILGNLLYFLIPRYAINSLTAFKKILNEMGTDLFITNAMTYKILFISDAMKNHYGFDDRVLDRPCWEVLQTGFTQPCPFCPLPKLLEHPTDSLVWEERNSLTGRYYKNTSSIIQWGNIKQAYLQHSVDIHDFKLDERLFKKRLEQQEFLSTISQSFTSTRDMAILINNALLLIGGFMQVSKVVLARLNTETGKLDYEYEWYNETQELSRLSKRSYFFSPGGILYNTFITDSKDYLACGDVEKNQEFLRFYGPLGIKAFISVPIVIQDTFWGVLGIDECVTTHQWDEGDIQFVQLIAHAIAGIIIRGIAEKKLLRMSSIVDSTPQYVSQFDSSGKFEYINQGVCAISGYSAEELMQHGMDLLFDEKTRAFIHNDYIPAVLEQGAYQAELSLIRKDGEQRVLSFTAFTLVGSKENIGGIATDITEIRRLEQDLIAAKERAEQSSLAKSNFLSRMSHEMRTPMNAIIGMTTIAQGSQDKERLQYCLTKINEASVHLLGVINDILDMSKIEAGKFELSYSEFDFEKMLLRVTGVMNFRLAEKRQDFIVHLDKDIPRYLITDEQRLAQVIANLLSNAVKFTPEEGTITLAVKQTACIDQGHTLQFSVTDTGIGISPEQQGRLFSSFEQADGSIARKFGGTGLGLAISRNIVELMGGKIWIDSALGKGATFTFEITAQEGINNHEVPSSFKVAWEKLRILVVDDSPEVLDYMREFAVSQGIQYAGASSGDDACQIMETASKGSGAAPFDLVFVDWRMPRMNGIELTKKIKERFGPHLVVIMISATEWNAIEAEAKTAGVDDFIPKPLFPSIIVDCINRHLKMIPYNTHEIETDQIPRRAIFAGRKVLLVEDVDINREIVISLLEHTGISIAEAENGIQAVRMFEEAPAAYHLILMDIHMPEMDGFEAAMRIRALNREEAKRIPIVAMTANVFREDIEQCLAAGMNDHLGKPIAVDELIKKLEKYLLP